MTGTNGYDQTFKTDKNGEIFIEGLRIGEYTVYEVSDSVSSGYILPADKQVTIKVDETATVEMHNELRERRRLQSCSLDRAGGGFRAWCRCLRFCWL